MHYGLAHLESTFHADSVLKAIHLAPCFYHGPDPDCSDIDCFNELTMKYQDYGIYAYNGPTKYQDLIKICWYFPAYECDLRIEKIDGQT